MFIALCLLLALLLLMLNAFFVLAEFASVRTRPTQMEALAAAGNFRAKLFQRIQARLDQYLSVCQIGITMASIGLGFVGEPAFAGLLMPLIRVLGIGKGSTVVAHGAAITIGYLLISFLHIVIGEQVPKLIAIRKTKASALFTAYPMVVFYYLFFVPLWLLNTTVSAILKLFGIGKSGKADEHSEEEVRIILSKSQSSGMMSFRRLMYMENVLDFGALRIRNAMRSRSQVRTLSTRLSREETDKIIADNRYSRYPLIDGNLEAPIGFIHIKDLFLSEHSGVSIQDLKSFVRPCPSVKEDDSLEPLLSEMQRKAYHIALVYDKKGRWTGIITLEDIIEEVIGTIEEEFPLEPRTGLSDFMSQKRVLLDIEGDSIVGASRNAILKVDKSELPPISPDTIVRGLTERELLGSSYVGKRLAIPHARLKNIDRPYVIVARLKEPIAAPIPHETIDILFILLTPLTMPRIHQILLSHIAGIFESEFFESRITTATTAAELYEAIKIAEQTALA
jgi:CBS domain containing-hemolysin-like protein/mannitol/fructose-specific phosphotransferase system IIA component (Ntr-type)